MRIVYLTIGTVFGVGVVLAADFRAVWKQYKAGYFNE